MVAKVAWHGGELFPRVGSMVTNITGWSRKVVKFYHGRGTAEQWIKEGAYAVKRMRLAEPWGWAIRGWGLARGGRMARMSQRAAGWGWGLGIGNRGLGWAGRKVLRTLRL